MHCNRTPECLKRVSLVQTLHPLYIHWRLMASEPLSIGNLSRPQSLLPKSQPVLEEHPCQIYTQTQIPTHALCALCVKRPEKVTQADNASDQQTHFLSSPKIFWYKTFRLFAKSKKMVKMNWWSSPRSCLWASSDLVTRIQSLESKATFKHLRLLSLKLAAKTGVRSRRSLLQPGILSGAMAAPSDQLASCITGCNSNSSSLWPRPMCVLENSPYTIRLTGLYPKTVCLRNRLPGFFHWALVYSCRWLSDLIGQTY